VKAQAAGREVAVAAVEEFIVLYDAEFQKDEAAPGVVAEALQRLSQVLAPVASKSDYDAAVLAVEDALRRYASRSPSEQFSARLEARAQLPRICGALDRALARFDQQPEIDAASAEVATLEGDYRRALAALERAVADADVPKVMELRGEVEVGLPGRLGLARLRLLGLQIAQAELWASRAPTRMGYFAAAVKTAEEEYAEAERRVEVARGEFFAAGQRRDTANHLASEAQRRVAALRAERDSLAASHEQDQQRRLRHLAGLADAPEVVAS
jgi:hypothetical protein